mgnify:CR=1 FL=1
MNLFIIQIFGANDDFNSEVRNDFDRPFVTAKIRIIPRSWQSSLACLRIEILGCAYEGNQQTYSSIRSV